MMTDEVVLDKVLDVYEELLCHTRDIEGQLVVCASRRFLSKKSGISPTQVWRSLKVLQKDGTIKAYRDTGRVNYYKVRGAE